jgi:hypothetical protein
MKGEIETEKRKVQNRERNLKWREKTKTR